MGHGNGDPKKVVVAALLGNAGIATAKFVAAFLSGSATMLAEAVHSVADTANQAFLLIGMRLSDQNSPDKYRSAAARRPISGLSSCRCSCSSWAACSPSTKACTS